MRAPGCQTPLAAWARREAIRWGRVLLLLAAWATSTSLSCTAGPKDEACCCVAASCSDTLKSLKELQTQNKQLRAQLSQSRWPGLKCFISDGQIYSLPLPATKQKRIHRPAEARLAYLAGFFDGDGSVSSIGRGTRLKVSQSFDQAEVLMLFRKTLGGSIAYEKVGKGLSKPSLQWYADGQSARRAADLLAPHGITKLRQLLLLAQWPDAKSPQRETFKAELRALKQHDSAVAGPCSWEYFTGFFDAEGYIEQPRGGASLNLRLGQKHPQVLKCLRHFLTEHSALMQRLRRKESPCMNLRSAGWALANGYCNGCWMLDCFAKRNRQSWLQT
ncbi:unnamed protein product [Symbiodinium sp. CCMP2592]|nr:unnamed protein product [Symbiodinium sp. CCMP2592]